MTHFWTLCLSMAAAKGLELQICLDLLIDSHKTTQHNDNAHLWIQPEAQFGQHTTLSFYKHTRPMHANHTTQATCTPI